MRIIRQVRPPLVLLENVPNLLAHRYFGTILAELAESGYDARWDCVPAAFIGAPHERDRLWIVAYTACAGERSIPARRTTPRGESETDADGVREGIPPENAHIDGERSIQPGAIRGNKADSYAEICGNRGTWWEFEPGLGRVVDGVANRVDRIGTLGEGMVPGVVKAFWKLLGLND